MKTELNKTSNNKQNNNKFALVVLTSLFFMWGFITCMNDILIPYLKSVFQLSHFEAMFIQFAFFGAYFVGSVIYFLISAKIGDPINKIGYKNGIFYGLVLSALGTFLFYPAAEFISYPLFLSALFILGLGFTILQIAANPYVAIIGSPDTASSRLNLSQGFNSLGTTIAPVLGGFLIFNYFAQNATGTSTKVPYLIFSFTFLILAFIIKFIHLPEFSNKEEIVRDAGALKYPYLVLGMLAIFLYVGGEVSIGSMMISYLGLKEIAGLKPEDASKFVAFYWGGLMIGRFAGAVSLSNIKEAKKLLLIAGIVLVSFITILLLNSLQVALIYLVLMILNVIAIKIGNYIPARTLFVFSIFAAALVLISIFTSGYQAVWSIIGVGLFNSIMWSNIFTLAIDKLGKYTSQGSSLLVMAILGGAILPLIMGKAADNIGVHLSFIVPFCSYIYLAFYGLKGYKIGKAV